MRVDSLPSPGLLSNGIRLRIEASRAISAVEINAGIPVNAGKSSSAKILDDFLVACRTAIATFIDTVAPTVTSRVIRNSEADQIYIAHSEGISPAFLPQPSAFVISGQTRTISKVEVDGPFVILTVTVPFVPGAVNVAYTQPGTAAERLRDLSGNLLASYTAQAVVNGVV